MKDQKETEHTEIQKVNAYCFALIKICRETEAETMTLNLDGATYLGKPIGDWQVIVKKK